MNIKGFKIAILWFATSLAFPFSDAQAAITWDVDPGTGQLLGASNVTVLGNLFNRYSPWRATRRRVVRDRRGGI